YLCVAHLLTVLICEGAPGLLHLLVVLCIWNSMKFALMGPVCVILLLRARASEWQERRMLRRSATSWPDSATSRKGVTGAPSRHDPTEKEHLHVCHHRSLSR
ncbi:hypothetical protein DN540_38105, partial [Burkholderia multivorans]